MARNLKDEDGLTRKQKAFADYLLKNPKSSATEAIQATYNATYNTAKMMSTQNMSNPRIQSYLAKHSQNIEQILIKNTYKLANSENLEEIKEGNKLLMYAHDKIHGKATSNIQSTNINVNIDQALIDLSK